MLTNDPLRNKVATRRLVPPNPPPRYDEVYAEVVEWLNSLAGPRIEATLSGEFVFVGKDGLYRLRARAKEIPYNRHFERSDESS